MRRVLIVLLPIAVLTGSIWDIILNLAWQFDVPPDHIASGRTAETFASDLMRGVPPIRVRYSDAKPEDAFVTVRAHDHWFYIDQHDRESKRAFSFLQLLLNLAETAPQAGGPLVTISN